MKYFKDTEDKLHVLDDAQYAHLLPQGSVQITDEEAESILQSQISVTVVPGAVSMRQARLALYDANLLHLVDETFALMHIEEQRVKSQIEWEFATTVQRDSALVYGLAGALGLTDEMLDDLFIKASKL